MAPCGRMATPPGDLAEGSSGQPVDADAPDQVRASSAHLGATPDQSANNATGEPLAGADARNSPPKVGY